MRHAKEEQGLLAVNTKHLVQSLLPREQDYHSSIMREQLCLQKGSGRGGTTQQYVVCVFMCSFHRQRMASIQVKKPFSLLSIEQIFCSDLVFYFHKLFKKRRNWGQHTLTFCFLVSCVSHNSSLSYFSKCTPQFAILVANVLFCFFTSPSPMTLTTSQWATTVFTSWAEHHAKWTQLHVQNQWKCPFNSVTL